MDEAPKESAAESSPPKTKTSNFWRPFTPRGIATFANAPLTRLMVLQMLLALFAACVVAWFLYAAYSPSIREALQKIPDSAEITQGRLTNVSSRVLTERKFLSIVVDTEETGQLGQVADLELELRPGYFQVCSLFGCVFFKYPPETIVLGRSTSEPWWGARQPVILVTAWLATFVGVWISWLALALIYTPIAKSIAYFADRELSWRGSWKLCLAAQMFGALLMTLSILFYGLQFFDLIQFLFFFAAHFVVAWIAFCAAPFFLPRVSMKTQETKNPFA